MYYVWNKWADLANMGGTTGVIGSCPCFTGTGALLLSLRHSKPVRKYTEAYLKIKELVLMTDDWWRPGAVV